jgi:hypothetical protein
MDKKAVFVDFTKYPELYEKLIKLAQENKTSAPPLIRKFVEDGLEAHEEITKVVSKIKSTKRVAG